MHSVHKAFFDILERVKYYTKSKIKKMYTYSKVIQKTKFSTLKKNFLLQDSYNFKTLKKFLLFTKFYFFTKVFY